MRLAWGHPDADWWDRSHAPVQARGPRCGESRSASVSPQCQSHACSVCPSCTGLLGSQVGQSSPSSKLSSGDSRSLQMAKQGLKACSQDHTSCLWLCGLLSQNTAHWGGLNDTFISPQFWSWRSKIQVSLGLTTAEPAFPGCRPLPLAVSSHGLCSVLARTLALSDEAPPYDFIEL